jgi:hypothetical protein
MGLLLPLLFPQLITIRASVVGNSMQKIPYPGGPKPAAVAQLPVTDFQERIIVSMISRKLLKP